MKLYYSPGVCSLASHIILHEAGLAHDIVKLDKKTHKLDDGTDFYTINPLGYVPVLELDNGQRLTETAAILQYLADQAPQKNLAPANGSWERYQLQSRLSFIACELHKRFAPMFKPGYSEEDKVNARSDLQQRFSYIDKLLGEQQYICGDTFTVADAHLFTILNWTGIAQVDISSLSNLLAYQARIAERPAVKAAMKAEGLIH